MWWKQLCPLAGLAGSIPVECVSIWYQLVSVIKGIVYGRIHYAGSIGRRRILK